MTEPEIAAVSPAGPEGSDILLAYFTDIVSRAYRRPATQAEVDAAMKAEPSDDLVPPTGLFLVARQDGGLAGCAGLRLISAEAGELTRLFVTPGARGQGLGRRLLAAVEDAARDHQLSTLRLDTSAHLTEAGHLYASAGYREVPQFSYGQVADRWYAKSLT